MGISEITSQGALPPADKGKKSKEPSRSSPGKKDKVELSSEAKSLFESGRSKRLEEIQQKIKDKYYDRPEVTEKVADALLKDMTK